ncbi:hypothetical protein LTR56_013748 [Elasticomyces elasticus]|nr:hypothetical protein LTR22_022829 [Elasticomyces elasticus]KAK3637213.1 hypothetical protein LTR56_013748 [Elasticomyces elasticus]KAK4907564.1 hypothetical protein LTR49_023431 [Elasticomyces elasticus]KAK5755293.1 hypothetical protein LTS12_014635 [Elasticomyces elasticus]
MNILAGIQTALTANLYSYQDIQSAFQGNLPRYHTDGARAADVRQGVILWLPTEAIVCRKNRSVVVHRRHHSVRFYRTYQSHLRVYKKAFGRPVLVVSRRQIAPNSIEYLTLTTFKDTPLEEEYPNVDDPRRLEYIPVSGSRRHPRAIPDLRYQTLTFNNVALDSPLELQRESYVRLRDVYIMPIAEAENFWARERKESVLHVLDRPSCRQVLGHLRSRNYLAGIQYHVTEADRVDDRIQWDRRLLVCRCFEYGWMILLSPIGMVLMAVVAWKLYLYAEPIREGIWRPVIELLY